MALTSGFWNSNNGDRKYTAEQFSQLISGIIYDGIFKNYGSAMKPAIGTTANTVTIAMGRAWVRGFWVDLDNTYIVSVSESDPTLSRWINIVIDVDKTDRRVTIKPVYGTLASSPSYPSLDMTRQLLICRVYQAAGSTTVSGLMDRRGYDECPWVTYIFDQDKLNELDQLLDEKADTAVAKRATNSDVLDSMLRQYTIPLLDYIDTQLTLWAYKKTYTNSAGSIQYITLYKDADFFDDDQLNIEYSVNGDSTIMYRVTNTSGTTTVKTSSTASSDTIACDSSIKSIDINVVNCNNVTLHSKHIPLTALANNIRNESYISEVVNAWLDAHPEATTNIADGSITEAKLSSDYKNNVWKKMYPIGSIYISVSSTSPASLFGGTWEQIKDRFLLASGDTYTQGATGGEANHTLTVAEMPRHDHKTLIDPISKSSASANPGKYLGSPNGELLATNDGSAQGKGFAFVTARTDATGSGQSHNNMPPYLVVNVWKRIA